MVNINCEEGDDTNKQESGEPLILVIDYGFWHFLLYLKINEPEDARKKVESIDSGN